VIYLPYIKELMPPTIAEEMSPITVVEIGSMFIFSFLVFKFIFNLIENFLILVY
jgi:hypothetical protein